MPPKRNRESCAPQMKKTTEWLLLLLLVVSSQSVDSQSTTDDERCDDGALKTDGEEALYNQLSDIRGDMQNLPFRLDKSHEELLSNIMDTQQNVTDRLDKATNRLEKSHEELLSSVQNLTDRLDKSHGELLSNVMDTQQNVTDRLDKSTNRLDKSHEEILSSVQNLTDRLEKSHDEILSSIQRLLDNQQNITDRLDALEKVVNSPKPPDCLEIYKAGKRSDGVYTVYAGRAQNAVEVYCDMTTDGGGWTVFQRRKDGSVDFYRNWANYTAGFGNLTGEFWLGNDALHLLTSDRRQRLRVDLADWDGNTRYAEYDNFTVESASTKYRLASLGTYNGTAGDSLAYHLGMKFTTKDQDNDRAGYSCAVVHKGGWWYNYCHQSNLNGVYNSTTHGVGLNWYHWKELTYSLKFTEMKIRPFHV